MRFLGRSSIALITERVVYRFLLCLLIPLALYLAKRIDRQSGQSRFKERFGFFPASSLGGQAKPLFFSKPLWIHAASVGEAKAAGLLIEALKSQGYDGSFVVTTTTATGADAIAPFLTENDQQLYAPYDLPIVVRRTLKQIRPSLLIVLEVEIWPTLWRQCHQQGVGIVMANARLSERSLRRYQGWFSDLWAQTLQYGSLVMAQSEAVADRYKALGVAEQRLRITGNLKFSQQTDSSIRDQGKGLRKRLGVSRPVWLAASTHETEEQIVLDCHRKLLSIYPDLLLVIVPRHPQRFDEVAELCQQSGLNWSRRSGGEETVKPEVQVYLGDTLGELLQFYAAVDLSWVAGSFVNVGGHNILEPAAYGCPIIVGPEMRNFADFMEEFLAQRAALQVQDSQQLYQAVQQMLESSEQRLSYRNNAQALLVKHQQAASNQAREVLRVLSGSLPFER
ncbi:3-deoxy-D-manno-octulosonic acid transferase [Motiliproteus sp. MSK22-1]|uniref:3-deoxy-D-manno-octulosonic acid transferase n=1 Tax=Motiliproteus sp. MSK22-1 TaxID=1897630 RepID=UPI000977A89A|nr:3-deoxy-D-manno-octulosonic acid transferase [Motiliproteus sp. MSK22-1]OMH28008.1 hypothetical protein BGP75_21790 [Motiliproteus sp. MSK22-1]